MSRTRTSNESPTPNAAKQNAAFTREMLTRGVVKAAQQFYVSLVHSEVEVTRTLEVFGEALTAVAGTSH